LSSISRLYLSGSSFDLDVTYGQGGFSGNLPAARYKFDVNPSGPEIIPGDARHVPMKIDFKDSTIQNLTINQFNHGARDNHDPMF